MIDDKTITLLKAIVTGLENDSRNGYEQFFNFEIRGKVISGSLKVDVKDIVEDRSIPRSARK